MLRRKMHIAGGSAGASVFLLHKMGQQYWPTAEAKVSQVPGVGEQAGVEPAAGGPAWWEPSASLVPLGDRFPVRAPPNPPLPHRDAGLASCPPARGLEGGWAHWKPAREPLHILSSGPQD